MTLNRRLSIFSVSLLLLLSTVGATGISTLLVLRPIVNGQRAIILERYRLDDVLILLSSFTLLAVVVTVKIALGARNAVIRRLRDFQLPPGGAPSALNDHAGDELDIVAQQLNELTAAVATLRAKQRSEDEVLAAK